MRPAPLALALSCVVYALVAPSAAAQQAAPPAASKPRAARSVRNAPADLLTDLRDDGSLVRGLEDPSAEARWVAARGLARLAEAEHVPLLAARLEREGDVDVLAELIFALGQRGKLNAEAAGPALVAALRHPSPTLRAGAVAALGRLFDDHHTAEVLQLLADESAAVRSAAALALFRLDGRRFEHERTAPSELLDQRDGLLSDAALKDADAGVRWRATYALAGIKERRDIARALPLVLDGKEPLTRLFALRGLRALEDRDRLYAKIDQDPLLDASSSDAIRSLDDPDELVGIERVRTVALSGSPDAIYAELRGSRSALLRYSAAVALRERLAQDDIDDATDAQWCESLQDLVTTDASPMVRREVAALIVALAPRDHALYDLYWLAGSNDWRDRERAAKELVLRLSFLDAPSLLERLLADEPTVAAACLNAYDADAFVDRLVKALASPDAALVTAAAEAAQAGLHSPGSDVQIRLVSTELTAALQAAHDRALGPEMKEARAMLRKALDLPPDTEPPAALPPGSPPLLDRLLAEHRDALADPSPRVELLTSRGRIELQLDRVNAPRHVASFLELAGAGFYDGLDFHRVVPNFVVQGLDPRGDGYGTGGRRLPDEFSPRPYEAGTVGMPNAGEPHTGGCQLFITHIPTPHLDGNYTVLGQVTAGMDVVQRLEIGDTVRSVRRIDS